MDCTRMRVAGDVSSIDAGVLSGTAALAAAADDLLTGRADVAIAGAISPPLSRALLQGLSGSILLYFMRLPGEYSHRFMADE